MVMKLFVSLPLLSLMLIVISCANIHCHHQNKTTKANAQMAEKDSIKPLIIPPSPKIEPNHVFVYKYDGSLQCGRGKQIPITVMEQELSPIKIFSKKTEPDGLMRIQMCGAPTGMAHLFEISRDDLQAAKDKGFELWPIE